jgi:hypothetical protein
MKKASSLGLSSAITALRNSMLREARQNAALRVSVKSQSAKRANARAASPPKRKARTPSPPKRKNPSPPKMTIGARVQLPIIITHPNGRIEVKFRTTRKYYAPNASKQYGYNLSKQVR